MLLGVLSVAGTAAMFLVGGGIVQHGIPRLAHGVPALAESVGGGPGWVASVMGFVIPAVVGVHQATQRLKTGQRIRLDGTRGLIQVLE